MSEIETLRAALTQVVGSYNYLTDNVGTITDDAYVAAEAALRQQAPVDSSEDSDAPTLRTELQRVDPFEMPNTVDYASMCSTAYSSDYNNPANDPIDW
jgi:hypothetical protein